MSDITVSNDVHSVLSASTLKAIRETLGVNTSIGDISTVFCIGDSLTANGYTTDLEAISGWDITRNATGGETSAQIKVRWDAASKTQDFFIIWAGRNDLNTLGFPQDTLANIESMVNSIPSGKDFIIIGVPKGAYAQEAEGNWRSDRVDKLNSLLQARYGSRFFDVNNYIRNSFPWNRCTLESSFTQPSLEGSISNDTANSDNTADWSIVDGSISFDSNHYEVGYSSATQWAIHTAASPVSIGAGTYHFSVDIKDGTESNVLVKFGTSNPSGGNTIQDSTGQTTTSSWTTYTYTGTLTGLAINNQPSLISYLSSGNFEFRNFKVSETAVFTVSDATVLSLLDSIRYSGDAYSLNQVAIGRVGLEPSNIADANATLDDAADFYKIIDLNGNNVTAVLTDAPSRFASGATVASEEDSAGAPLTRKLYLMQRQDYAYYNAGQPPASYLSDKVHYSNSNSGPTVDGGNLIAQGVFNTIKSRLR